jgi:hypothetical protein
MMVLRGLELNGKADLAHELAKRHVAHVCECYSRTGTFFENYAPEIPSEGRHRRDFVGWTGLSPTAILFEHVFGLRPDVRASRLLWDVRLLDGHGVKNYPFGAKATLDLYCGPRVSEAEEPKLVVRSSEPVKIRVRWAAGTRTKLFGG